MTRRIETRAGRIVATVALFVVATVAVSFVVGVLGSSNAVWGEDNQYGRVDIPGTKVLRLPAGTVDVSAAVALPGRGNETPSLPLPKGLSLTVTPLRGAGRPVVRDDVGDTENADDDRVDTQRRVWRIDVPSDGDYRVAARGSFLGIAVNPELWFGHGPPIPGALAPVIAAVLVALGGLVWLVAVPRLRRRRAS